jgi:hypothetical protein
MIAARLEEHGTYVSVRAPFWTNSVESADLFAVADPD